MMHANFSVRSRRAGDGAVARAWTVRDGRSRGRREGREGGARPARAASRGGPVRGRRVDDDARHRQRAILRGVRRARDAPASRARLEGRVARARGADARDARPEGGSVPAHPERGAHRAHRPLVATPVRGVRGAPRREETRRVLLRGAALGPVRRAPARETTLDAIHREAPPRRRDRATDATRRAVAAAHGHRRPPPRRLGRRRTVGRPLRRARAFAPGAVSRAAGRHPPARRHRCRPKR